MITAEIDVFVEDVGERYFTKKIVIYVVSLFPKGYTAVLMKKY